MSMNTIHYAVEIITDYAGTIGSIGMNDTGIIRYVTDGYDPISNNAKYEDNTLVIGTWATEFLSKNGIKPSSQQIDIIAGGDYAFLGNFEIEIININQIHKQLLETAGLNIIGSIVKFYVIIDDVFYSRGVFAVSEYNFNDKTFKFQCKDIHNKDNDTIENYIIGYSHSELEAVIKDKKAFVVNKFLNNVMSDERKYKYTCNEVFKDNVTSPTKNKEGFERTYVGFGNVYDKIMTTSNNLLVVVSGIYKNIKKGMYLSISNAINETSNDMLYIEDVIFDEPFNYTNLIVSNVAQVTDYGNFYGRQHSSALIPSIDDAVTTADDNTLTVSVFKDVLVYNINKDTNIITKNGYIVGVDSNGDEVLYKGYKQEDKLYITSHKSISIKYPSKIGYFATNDESIRDTIEQGKMINFEQYVIDITTKVPQKLEHSDESFETNKGLFHYFTLQFDDDMSSYTPGVMFNAGTDNVENWLVLHGNSSYLRPRIIDTENWNDGGVSIDRNNEFNGSYSSISDIGTQTFPVYYTTWYKLVDDEDYGLVPFVSSDFMLPNMRNTTDFRWNADDFDSAHYIASFKVKSADATNIPSFILTDINDNYVTVFDNVYNYINGTNTSNMLHMYIGGIDNEYDNSSDEIPVLNKVLISVEPRIRKDQSGGQFGDNVANIVYDTTGSQDTMLASSHNTFFNVSLLSAYKVSDIEIGDSVILKTINNDANTYPKLLNGLTGISSVLTNRNTWYVGGQIKDKVNKFNIITDLCKQGFIAGYTNRFGNIDFSQFLEEDNTPAIHDNNTILKDSIKNFRLSSISKCYNEFTIKYHNGDKEIGIYNVDKDSFPDFYDFDWQPYDNPTGNHIIEFFAVTDPSHPEYGIYSELNPYDNPWETDPTTDDWFRITSIDYNGMPAGKVLMGNFLSKVQGDWDIALINCSTDLTPNSGETYYGDYDHLEIAKASEGQKWQQYVTGIDDYYKAKELWEMAHKAYLTNKRKRQAPSDRANLDYAIDLSSFYNSNVPSDILFGFYIEYAYNYAKMFIEWTTRQKLQVNYSIPITDENIKIDLMNDIHFNDPIITPDPGEYGKGWITKYKLDTVKDKIDVELTFEADFLSLPISIDCGNIIEIGTEMTVDNIIENENNTDNIIESECNHNG